MTRVKFKENITNARTRLHFTKPVNCTTCKKCSKGTYVEHFTSEKYGKFEHVKILLGLVIE